MPVDVDVNVNVNVPKSCCPIAAAILLSALALGLGGCSNDPWNPVDTLPRVPVAGTVTLDGTPLAQGMIQFNPTGETTGTTVAAEITGGKYAIEKAQGPVPGKHKVLISGRPPARLKPGEPPGGTPKPTPEPIPARYNSQSTLETEVPAGGSQALDFALKTS
jgi:hypothetical protein